MLFGSKKKDTAQLDALRDQVIEKAQIVMGIYNKPSILVPIGSEWESPEFFQGMHTQEVKGYRDNEETTCILVDGLKGSRLEAHYHDNSEKVVVVKGAIRCPVNNKTVQVMESWVINPGQVHSFEFLEDSLLFIMWHPKFKNDVRIP